jgi:hypothetical protein
MTMEKDSDTKEAKSPNSMSCHLLVLVHHGLNRYVDIHAIPIFQYEF